MTDLPTRLRTRADLHDHLTAGLMRAAGDEIERLRAAALPVDDSTLSLNRSALPSVMIWDGGDAYAELTERNALPATDPRSLDLDACAIAVGIYRAMTAAAAKAPKPSPASSPILKAGE